MDKLNFKLSKFFYEHKSMFKKADMGYFESVLSPEDIKTISPMLNEMMELPKYKPTIDKLKTSLGVVNFVTKDGYAPLIEFLLKTAFPLNYNDVFNIEESEITGDSFSIGANFFGTVMDAKGTAIPSATKKLEDLLLGSDALMTRDWLKEQKGMTDGTIDSIYGKFKGGTIQEWLAGKAEAEKEALAGGMMPGQFPPPDEVKNSPAPAAEIGWQMAVYEYQVKAINDKWSPEIQRLENELSGLQLPAQQENQEKALPSEEHTRTIKESIKALISARQETLLRLKQEFYPALGPATVNKMKGTASKNKDGFVNYNPAKSLVDTSRELIRYMSLYNPAQPKATMPIREGDKIQGKPVGALAQAKILELRNLLAQYRSTDPNYTKIMDEFLKLMGQGNPDDLARIKANLRGTTARLQKILTDRVMKHGKVLILDELDKTVMCHQAQKGVVEMDKSIRHLLSQFISINNTNREKDNAPKGKKEYGNRIVVALSTEPIGNLPSGSTVIELDTSPVNAEEASIIVKYCIDEIDRDKNAYLKYKKFEDLEAKENSKETKIKLTPKEMESLVPDYIRRKVSAYISGLNVRDAITAVRTTLQYAINKNEEDVLRPKISIDADRLLKTLRDDVNKRIQTDVLGVKIGHADVKFDEYAYNKYSQWATQVEGVGAVKMALSSFSALIKSDKLRLAEIDDILEKNADNHGALKQSDKDYYVAEREVLISRITYNEQQRSSMAANDIPHIYLLWGKPGVGKCLGRGTKVMMFNGDIKSVEDIVVGDLLMGPDSKPRTVLTTISGIGPLYRVDQKLGEPYVCNNAHILSLQNTDKPSDQDPIFISAEDFCKKNETWKYRQKGWKVGVEFEEKEVPIDPYWLGLWLGDGISRLSSIMVANIDGEIGDWLQKWAENNHVFVRKESQPGCEAWHFTDMRGRRSGCTSNHIKTMLRGLNLLQNKHIPEMYFKNSSKNRLALLAGMIDSDGYKTKTGSVQFTNVNKRLALDFLRLARSLGFRATFAEGIKGIAKINYKVKAYTITLGGTLSRIPSKLTRKQGHDNPQKRSLRYGIKVEPIGEGEYFGFTIDGDQQFLLGDFTVTHNSVWAHALADLFDLSIVEVDITAQFDKWVGSTGKNARGLLNMMGNSKATVFLIDEIDRQVQSGSQKNKVQQDAHETTKQVVYHFLQFFEDTANNRLFKANEIFFIMTSNNEDCIDKAWLQRTGTGFYEVKLPEDPADYEKFFKSYMNVERARFPDSPWLQDPEEVARLSKELANLDDKERTKIIREKGWETTFKIINTQLDWHKIAAEFSGKRIDFRTLKMILQQAYSFNGMWNNSMSRISGTTDASVALKEIRGLPLTTENILQSAKFAETSEIENSRFNLGITDVAMRKRKKIDQMATKYANKPLATSPHLDPFAQKLLETPGLSEQRKQEILKRYQTQKTALPQEIIDFMQKGEVSVEAEPDIPLPEYDYEEDVDPKTGLVKGVKPKSLTPKQPQVPPVKTPQQEAQELMQESFEETEEGMPEQNKEEDEEVKVKSSTDYYYNFLRKNGILDKEGKIQVSKLNEVKQLKEARQNKLVPSRQNQAKKGELFYDGAVMIVEAP